MAKAVKGYLGRHTLTLTGADVAGPFEAARIVGGVNEVAVAPPIFLEISRVSV